MRLYLRRDDPDGWDCDSTSQRSEIVVMVFADAANHNGRFHLGEPFYLRFPKILEPMSDTLTTSLNVKLILVVLLSFLFPLVLIVS